MKKTDKRIVYFLSFLVMIALLYIVTPTFAEFMDDYTTENDVVGLNLNFNLQLSNIEEYEEITIDSNSYEIYNIDITNSLEDTIYYGVWYKMVNPKELTDDIVIARLDNNRTSLADSIDGKEKKEVSIIIKNNTTDSIIINIGIASSKTSTQDIEYLGGKHLITGEEREIDYYYDDENKRYVSTLDNNTYFSINSTTYNDPKEIETYTTNHDGVFKVEIWGASIGEAKGGYASANLKLKTNELIYNYIGEVDKNTTDIRIYQGEREDIQSKDSTIMRMGTTNDDIYISGYFGSLSSNLDDSLKEKCKTGTEDIICSYHYSGKIFKNIQVFDGNSEIPSPTSDDKQIGNQGDGAVRITPLTPSIEANISKITVGTNYDVSSIKCIDNGSGCNLIKTQPEFTDELMIGPYKLNIIVMDDNGFIYRYTKDIEIVE